MDDFSLRYRNASNRVALAMLLMLILFGARSLFFYLFPAPFAALGEAWDNVLSECIGGLLYAAALLAPARILCVVSRGTDGVSLRAEPQLPAKVWLYLAVGLAAIEVAALLNSLALSFIDYSSFEAEYYVSPAFSTNAEIVLALLTTAVIPAFAEECLFRGTVLPALLPYGKSSALIASALLFGLMHQNAGQFFYSVIAGLILGYLYMRTRSIWCGVLLHFLNNALSLFRSVLYARLPALSAGRIVLLGEGTLILLGLIAFIFLITDREETTAPLLGAPDADFDVTPRRRVKLFLGFPMLAYFLVTVGEMIVLLILAVGGYL